MHLLYMRQMQRLLTGQARNGADAGSSDAMSLSELE